MHGKSQNKGERDAGLQVHAVQQSNPEQQMKTMFRNFFHLFKDFRELRPPDSGRRW
jgi:hypothetical protein